METVYIPITEFYQKSLDSVYKKGFLWVVSLIARDADVKGLYKNLCESWDSLDSITGEYFLFVCAGKENKNSSNSAVFHPYQSYKEANPYVEFLNQNINLYMLTEKDYYEKKIKENQTMAVNALRDYFSINESDIPCILFTKLGAHNYANRVTYVVPITGNDIYGYFKDLFNEIEPLLKQYKETLVRINELVIPQKDLRIELKIKVSKNPFKSEKKILELRQGLLIHAAKNIINEEGYSLLDCMNNLSCGRFDEPLQSMLNLYIKWVKNYEKRTGSLFDIELAQRNVCQMDNVIEQIKTKISMIEHEKDELEQKRDTILCKIEKAIGGSKMTKDVKEKVNLTINVNGNNSQIVNITDSEDFVVTQNIGCNKDEIMKLIESIRKVSTTNMSAENIKDIDKSLKEMEDELKKVEPQKSVFKTAVKNLKAIKGTAEFVAAVGALAQLIMQML